MNPKGAAHIWVQLSENCAAAGHSRTGQTLTGFFGPGAGSGPRSDCQLAARIAYFAAFRERKQCPQREKIITKLCCNFIYGPMIYAIIIINLCDLSKASETFFLCCGNSATAVVKLSAL